MAEVDDHAHLRSNVGRATDSRRQPRSPGSDAECPSVATVGPAAREEITDERYHSPPPSDSFVRTGRLREQAWLYSRRAPGNARLSGLRADLGPLAAPGTPGPVNPGSKGCGTVMRSAPFGLAARDARDAFDLAARCAQITHGHPTGYLAAGARSPGSCSSSSRAGRCRRPYRTLSATSSASSTAKPGCPAVAVPAGRQTDHHRTRRRLHHPVHRRPPPVGQVTRELTHGGCGSAATDDLPAPAGRAPLWLPTA
ncbi:ADP-ribosylglycohydrolase family protein [Planotetraspora sp. GP83]|uniref:ADP-ribosylglycohydrolase family protein n=1 Tax=Planotetraspora sp. GP83 TaxID=3156264 RepID=UPI003512041E